MAGPYYVATSDGNDAYNGLYDHFISGSDGPWKTLSKAPTVLVAGGTVYGRTGTYNEVVNLTAGVSGTAGNPITYKNYTGETPIVDAQSTRDACFKSGQWASPAGVRHYITIDGFEVKNSTESGIVFDRNQATQAGSIGSHDITIKNCNAHDNYLYGITVEGGDVGTGGESYNILITLNYCHHNDGHNIKFQGDTAHVINRLQIRNSEVSWNEVAYSTGVSEGNAQGIHLSTGAHDTVLSHNTAHHNQASGISTYEAWNMTIEYNSSYSNGTGHIDGNSEGIWQAYPSNNIIRYNRLNGNFGSGIYIAGDLAGSPTKSSCYYNIISNNGTDLNTGYGGITSDNALAHDFYNNTLYNNHCSQIYIKTSVNHNVKNNIMYSVGAGRAADFLIRINVVAGWTANKIDYNCYYTTDLTNPWYWNPNQRATFSLWKSDSSMDAHGINVDPSFSETSTFFLNADSPCINNGLGVGLTQDFGGEAIKGTPDMGARESPYLAIRVHAGKGKK